MTEGAALVSTVAVQALLHGARIVGLDVDAIVASVGLSTDALFAPDAILPAEAEPRIWRKAIQRGGASIGIDAARRLPRGALGVIEYIFRSSDDLEAALLRLVRYNRVIQGSEIFWSERVGDDVHLVYESPYPDGDAIGPVAAEFTLGAVVVLARSAAGADVNPREVQFRHRRPPDLQPLRQLFGVDPRFGAARTAVAFGGGTVTRPMLGADAVLCALLERAMGAQLGRPQSTDHLSGAVRHAIGELLPQGPPALEAVAERLRISPRVLQKRLKEVGTSYQTILDETRETLAKRYLEREDRSLLTVATLLGYSELSAFHRAFKRWTGMTPGQWRAQR
jgi:AraC-like DNA-binding protein